MTGVCLVVARLAGTAFTHVSRLVLNVHKSNGWAVARAGTGGRHHSVVPLKWWIPYLLTSLQVTPTLLCRSRILGLMQGLVVIPYPLMMMVVTPYPLTVMDGTTVMAPGITVVTRRNTKRVMVIWMTCRQVVRWMTTRRRTPLPSTLTTTSTLNQTGWRTGAVTTYSLVQSRISTSRRGLPACTCLPD